MSTLISSREKPRFNSASTADSAATLLLKSAVTNFEVGLAIQSSQQTVSTCLQTATAVPTHNSSNCLIFMCCGEFLVFDYTDSINLTCSIAFYCAYSLSILAARMKSLSVSPLIL